MIAAKTLSELAGALPGQLLGSDATITSISIDTRTVEPGQLFVAIKGPNFDGHNYVQAALDKGAAGVIVSEDRGAHPAVLVNDTEKALSQTGVLNRDAFQGTVLGVTGSSGKTSVKEMLAAIFSQVAPTLSTVGNLNNYYGVPVTLSRLTSEHQFAVIEMGTNSPGEIAHLTEIVRPHIAIVNNASISHVAGLGSLMGIVEEKGAIFDHLTSEGTAIVNLDDAHCGVWIERIAKNAGCRVLSFSLKNESATSWPSDITTDEEGMHFTLNLAGKKTQVNLQFWGKHQVANACAAAVMAHAAGLDIETIAAGLGAARPYARRGQRFRSENGAMIIDESYNANPDSTKASIDALADCSGYRMLVLGELSAEHYLNRDEGIRMHRELGEYASQAGIDHVLTCGELSAHVHDTFSGEGQHFSEKNALIDWLKPHLNAGVVVLVKGSMLTGMNDVVTACIAKTEPSIHSHLSSDSAQTASAAGTMEGA
ncbi:UDP-N-acetylmuramoyl-tripeptide--D-alanyl-D-alanine ligase [Parendozoicomonas haliclonae]|uniref:UDP-N-acetylmuramoyl-tripeptide--D-alanyl-D-alanine ligase n=1 Tax=Parendozoicomonas haliclonae TaxID=1960125 RepID=A0A1X7AED3_9GAMM|nr:UDP-N-acetylmuramoyl-tripeptide--D-alanyl-D-alanine ligase [Parendozoicomonas haliclonae]SMA34188.1 UDP-N-acetylmuramoyl-tripeptide-D-alanyl-D-alanine ligase [Parendozoicomonas haliclonae]